MVEQNNNILSAPMLRKQMGNTVLIKLPDQGESHTASQFTFKRINNSQEGLNKKKNSLEGTITPSPNAGETMFKGTSSDKFG